MYCGAAVVVFVYLVLRFLAGREKPLSLSDFRGKKSSLPKGIGRVAMFLYKKACLLRLPFFHSDRVRQDLERLYPGQAGGPLETAYYVDKLGLTLVILLAGTLLATGIRFRSQSGLLLGEENRVTRGEPGEADSSVLLEASDSEGNAYAYRISIASRRMTEEETEAEYELFLRELPALILGENRSLEEVEGDLILSDGYEGFPFEVVWESSRPERTDRSGRVVQPESAGEEVILKAGISYDDFFRELEIPLTVVPPTWTEEERRYRALETELLQTELDSRREEAWKLPEELEGSELVWRQRSEDKSIMVLAAAIAAAAAIYWMKDRDLHGDLEKRRQQMRQDYPDVVHKLALFLGAGMTLRGAFSRIATEYEQKKGDIHYIYEEMRYTCRELQTGTSEGAGYEHFGRRTGLQEYIRLSTLLSQNLKKGSATLLPRLREEAEKASEERLQVCRKLGEEAVTKLLVPMVLLLLVAMVMIIVPAFSSVGL